MGCHDAGRTEVNLAISVPRDKWEPVPGLPKKVSAVVECPHLPAIAKVSDADFFGTENGRITGMSVHHIEGMATGATLGVVAGHKTSDGKFVPLQTEDTTAHMDLHGDTHVYHAVVSGRTPAGGAQKVAFKAPKPEEHAKEEQIKAKVERWSGVESAGDMRVFSAKNTEGKSKSLAAIKTSDPLGKLIERNQGNPKFTASTGSIRTVKDGDKKHFVLDADKARELWFGLDGALAPQTKWAKSPFALRLFTDKDAVKDTGKHPFNGHITLHRDGATKVDYDEESSTTANVDLDTSGLIGDEDDSLARAVFAGEEGVVSISADGEGAGGDGL